MLSFTDITDQICLSFKFTTFKGYFFRMPRLKESKTRLKRIEPKIAREAVSKTQNTFKNQNTSKTLNLFNNSYDS